METIFSPHITGEELELKKGSVLFRADEFVRSIHFLVSGAVKLERYTEDGKEVITAHYIGGGYVAEASLFRNRYHCRSVATQSSDLVRFSRQDVLESLETIPGLAVRYAEMLSSEIRDLREQVQLMNVRAADERILDFLRSNAEDGVYTFPGAIQDLAAQLGMSRETLYRKLSELEISGRIERIRRSDPSQPGGMIRII